MSETKEKLLNEVLRLKTAKPDSKIKVTDVACAVGVSHSTIYNRHPEVNDAIKAHNLSLDIASNDTNSDKLKKLRKEKRTLSEEVQQLKIDKNTLVSINARYELENAELNKKVNFLEKQVADLKRHISKIGNLHSKVGN